MEACPAILASIQASQPEAFVGTHTRACEHSSNRSQRFGCSRKVGRFLFRRDYTLAGPRAGQQLYFWSRFQRPSPSRQSQDASKHPKVIADGGDLQSFAQTMGGELRS
jgi:hypothetical protein